MVNDGSKSQTLSWTSHHPSKFQKLRAHEILGCLGLRAILAMCKEKRGIPELTCRFPKRWSMGTRNLVLEARFGDGVRWVIKVHMLSLSSPCGFTNGSTPKFRDEEADESDSNSDKSGDSNASEDGEDPYDVFKQEFETMEFIKSHTNIPIPTPHFLKRISTSLGPTAILAMDFVGGVSGSSFFKSSNLDELPERRERYRSIQDRILRSMAEVHLTLARFKAPVGGIIGRCISHCCKWPVGEGFGVVDEPEGFHALYDTPLECFKHYIDRRTDRFAGKDDSGYAPSSRNMLRIIEANYQKLCNMDGQFYLTNIDAGGHNAIFSSDGNLQAIIDIDALLFLPIEIVAQLPAQFGLNYYPVEEDLAWMNCREKDLSCASEYAKLIRQAGRDCGLGPFGEFFASHVESEAVALVAGLFVIDEEEEWLNKLWLDSDIVSRFPYGDLSVPALSSASGCSSQSLFDALSNGFTEPMTSNGIKDYTTRSLPTCYRDTFESSLRLSPIRSTSPQLGHRESDSLVREPLMMEPNDQLPRILPRDLSCAVQRSSSVEPKKTNGEKLADGSPVCTHTHPRIFDSRIDALDLFLPQVLLRLSTLKVSDESFPRSKSSNRSDLPIRLISRALSSRAFHRDFFNVPSS